MTTYKGQVSMGLELKMDNEHIVRYCAMLGLDTNLVQGAGGNVSWKDGDTLWVKASGTWLSQAAEKGIFVPMIWSAAKALAEEGGGDYVTCVIGKTALRPSIETALHALLPQQVVVHCHAIDVIVHSVMESGRETLNELLHGIDWIWIDYVKPGPDLAAAVHAQLQASEGAIEVIVLANHGLVVAGPDIEYVNALLEDIKRRVQIEPRPLVPMSTDEVAVDAWDAVGYRRSGRPEIQSLAIDSVSLMHAKTKWVLYPDHAVFLGATAAISDVAESPSEFLKQFGKKPVAVIVPGVDVFISAEAPGGAVAMLECYASIARRIPESLEVMALSNAQIETLLDWDAEKYRQRLNDS